jgi:hypothetical protein
MSVVGPKSFRTNIGTGTNGTQSVEKLESDPDMNKIHPDIGLFLAFLPLLHWNILPNRREVGIE